jgi:hypothetical protein
VVSSRFGFLRNLKSLAVADVTEASERLIAAIPQDLDCDLTSELLQFKAMPFKTEVNQPIELSMYLLIKENCLGTCYPNVEIILQIYLTLMVTNCTGERSFSKLKRVKNELRTTMVDRLD